MALAMAHAHIGPASEVADEIERYLVDHPEASDNLIGVVKCWLNRDPSQTMLLIADAALGDLVSRGKVDRFALPDGGAVFRKASRG
jgi:hypothetical protein